MESVGLQVFVLKYVTMVTYHSLIGALNMLGDYQDMHYLSVLIFGGGVIDYLTIGKMLPALFQLIHTTSETQQCTHTMPSGYALCSTFVPGDRHVLIGTKVCCRGFPQKKRCGFSLLYCPPKAGEVQLFDVAAGSQLETVPAHQGAVWSLCMAPDKRGFVTGSADHEIKFWEFELVSDEGGESK